jgi:hypothetical protein
VRAHRREWSGRLLAWCCSQLYLVRGFSLVDGMFRGLEHGFWSWVLWPSFVIEFGLIAE